MAIILDNLIHEICDAAVLAADALIPLGGAVPGYRTFAAKAATNDVVHYAFREVDSNGRPNGQWELGRGVFKVSGGLPYIERSLVVDSSAGGGAIDFGAGRKHICLTMLAPTHDLIRADQRELLELDEIGMVAYFAMPTPPPGWLKANGAAMSRTVYARLFARIGVTHGPGNGTSTFNLPDGRGEFMRGWDDGRGVDVSRVLGSAQAAANAAHIHAVTDPGHTHTVNDPSHFHNVSSAMGNSVAPGHGGFAVGPQEFGDVRSTALYAASNVSLYAAYSGVSVQSQGSEGRPRNLALLCCIRYA